MMTSTEMLPASLRALDRAPGYEPGRRHLVLEIHPVLPGEVEGSPARHRHRGRTLPDVLDLPERDLESRGLPDQSDVLPHHVAELLLERVEILAVSPAQRRGEAFGGRV